MFLQGSKRVFRSNEIFLSSNGLVDTTLELTFSLQVLMKTHGNIPFIQHRNLCVISAVLVLVLLLILSGCTAAFLC